MLPVEAIVSRLYEQDAHKLAALIKKNPLSIVVGEHGNGKSSILLPRVDELLTAQGFGVVKIDDSELVGDHLNGRSLVNQINNIFLATKKGVVILDEGRSLIGEGIDHAKKVTTLLRSNGYLVVPVIPYRCGRYEEDAVSQVRIWEGVGRELNGVVPPTFKLESKRLDQQLARELLAQPKSGNDPLSPEVIDFILSRVPYNLRILDHFREYPPESIDDVECEVAGKIDEWFKYTRLSEWSNKR